VQDCRYGPGMVSQPQGHGRCAFTLLACQARRLVPQGFMRANEMVVTPPSLHMVEQMVIGLS
jgi:hypothetical protein